VIIHLIFHVSKYIRQYAVKPKEQSLVLDIHLSISLFFLAGLLLHLDLFLFLLPSSLFVADGLVSGALVRVGMRLVFDGPLDDASECQMIYFFFRKLIFLRLMHIYWLPIKTTIYYILSDC